MIGFAETQGGEEILERVQGQVAFEFIVEVEGPEEIQGLQGEKTVDEPAEQEQGGAMPATAIGELVNVQVLLFHIHMHAPEHPGHHQYGACQSDQDPYNRVTLPYHLQAFPRVFGKDQRIGIEPCVDVRELPEIGAIEKKHQQGNDAEVERPPSLAAFAVKRR